jgi:hypothetical protein
MRPSSCLRVSIDRACAREWGQTRTWNLMIDVIAQTGRYKPSASTLAGFLVEVNDTTGCMSLSIVLLAK